MKLKDIKELQSVKIDITFPNGEEFKNFPNKIRLVGMFAVIQQRPIYQRGNVRESGWIRFVGVDTNYPNKILQLNVGISNNNSVFLGYHYPLSDYAPLNIPVYLITRTRIPSNISERIKIEATKYRKDFYLEQKNYDREYIKENGKSIYGTKIPDKYKKVDYASLFNELDSKLPDGIDGSARIFGNTKYFETDLFEKEDIDRYPAYLEDDNVVLLNRDMKDEDLVDLVYKRGLVDERVYNGMKDFEKFAKKYPFVDLIINLYSEKYDRFSASHRIHIKAPKRITEKYVKDYIEVIKYINKLGIYR